MTNYETFKDKANKEGLDVKEKELRANKGRIKGTRIAIKKRYARN